MTSRRVYSVSVTFHPELPLLLTQLRALLGQVSGVVIVDNGDPDPAVIAAVREVAPHVHWIQMPENRGLGAAQNAGIAWCLQQRADAIVLMDQDSTPSTDMVAQLLHAYDTATAGGLRVAAVGANYSDDRLKNAPPFLRIKGGRIHRARYAPGQIYVDVDYVISSGCLVLADAVAVAGPMDEGLFIDYVDTEWGLRAQSHGFEVIGAWRAQLRHRLGDQPIRFMGRIFPNNAPYRQYSMFRNAMVLIFRKPLPLRWKVVESYRLLMRAVFYSCLAPPRLRRFRAIVHGISDGLQGRQGSIDHVIHRYPPMSPSPDSTSPRSAAP